MLLQRICGDCKPTEDIHGKGVRIVSGIALLGALVTTTFFMKLLIEETKNEKSGKSK